MSQAQKALKVNMGQLLGKLASTHDLDRPGSKYLALRLSGKSETTGLETGLLISTDRQLGHDARAAYQTETNDAYAISYGAQTLDCVWVQELSEDNMNVQELTWNARTSPARPRLTEAGFANVPISDIFGDYRDCLARAQEARHLGVSQKDFVLFEGFADAQRVHQFFGQILGSAELPRLQPVAPSSRLV
jgi:hypothetical protein